ncbi:MAG TPA: hypothetical protein EYP85_15990 [Armatimonadetes bacterium]|nr:hypothetical protein [Armatimonadota bacterium]
MKSKMFGLIGLACLAVLFLGLTVRANQALRRQSELWGRLWRAVQPLVRVEPPVRNLLAAIPADLQGEKYEAAAEKLARLERELSILSWAFRGEEGPNWLTGPAPLESPPGLRAEGPRPPGGRQRGRRLTPPPEWELLPPPPAVPRAERERARQMAREVMRALHQRAQQGYDVRPARERLEQVWQLVREGRFQEAEEALQEVRRALKEARPLTDEEVARRPRLAERGAAGGEEAPQPPRADAARREADYARQQAEMRERARQERMAQRRAEGKATPKRPVRPALGERWELPPGPPPMLPREFARWPQPETQRPPVREPRAGEEWASHPPAEPKVLSLSNGRLELTLDPQQGTLTVSDRVTKTTWEQVVGEKYEWEDFRRNEARDSLEGRLWAGVPGRVHLRLAADAPEVIVSLRLEDVLSAEENHHLVLAYPHPFRPTVGTHLALPLAEGALFAAGEEVPLREWTEMGELTAPWFGLSRGRAGCVTALFVPEGWKAALHFYRPEGTDVPTLAPVWRCSEGPLEAELKVVYHFTSRATYAGLAQAFAALANRPGFEKRQ